MTAQLCITVIGKDATRFGRPASAAEVDADLVELRLDSMAAPDPEAALAGRRKPAIVTCRPLREGGMFDGSEEERLRILERAQALGAEFVDIEWDIRRRAVRRGARREGRDRLAPRLPGCAGRFAGPAAAASRDRRGSREGRGHGGARVRSAEAAGERASGRRIRPDRDGARGAGDARPRRRDSARGGPMRATASRRARSRPRGCCEEFKFRRIRPDAGGVCAARPARGRLAVARDAQRGVRRARPERGLRADRVARHRGLQDARRARSAWRARA